MILKIKDFGPLKFSEVEFNKITLFIGPQGSGKSTIAKLYSLFMWLEKRLLRGLDTAKQTENLTTFKKKLCGYHGLTDYFKDSTEILFDGQHYLFKYKDSQFQIEKKFQEDNLEVYKVLYIPSDRNLLSVLDDLTGIKKMPQYLQSFREEYTAACKELPNYKLPIDSIRFEYDKKSKKTWLKGEDFKIRLSDASSGFQAALPLLLVSDYMTSFVGIHKNEKSNNGLNLEEMERLQKEVRAIINNKNLSSAVKQEALSALSTKFGYTGFVNIVEEPEQNLYPTSQKNVLYDLLRLTQIGDNSKLVITTHSPYIIDYLTLSIKASELIKIGCDKHEIERIVPLDSCVPSNMVTIYQLSEGYANLLGMPNGIPSDRNDLNELLSETNKEFDVLLDIEDSKL